MAVSMSLFLATDEQAYEHFMARWSRRLAGPLLDFAGIKAGDPGAGRRLWHGCHNGGAGGAGLHSRRARRLGALPRRRPPRDRSHPNIVYELGDACRMPYADASFDACVSALAIDVIPEVDQAVLEMRRVTRGGGTVASATFDFWGGFSPADLVCDTASVLDEGMRSVRD
jgi:SAM-dependent methyltransferase